MEIGQGRPLYPQGVPQVKQGDGTQEAQDAVAAAGVLARIRAMLGGAPLETSPASASEASEAPRNTPRDTSAEELRTERAAVRRLRHENSDLKRQLAESQGAVRALKEELASGGARSKTRFPKPYRSLSDQDHEKVLAFVEKHGLNPAEDYDRALMGLTSTGQIKAQR